MKLDAVLKEYEARFAEHGDTAQGHGWGSEASVAFRKTALLSVFAGVTAPFTALDFGCGTGDFSEDLSRIGLTEYCGVEAVPAIREAAKKRYPKHWFAEFMPEGQWDYVFASGPFNLKMNTPEDAWENWVERHVKGLWERTRIALVMNFVTYKPDWREDDLWYPAGPTQIVDWVKPREFLVLEDYGLRGEWTIILGK